MCSCINPATVAGFLQPNLASMEGDTVFVADTQPLSPRLVIEVGDSQSYESLKLKADGWFEYFPVRLLIFKSL